MCIRDRSGLIAATFCRNHVADPVHPTRSASTVAGIEGVASSSCLTCCSNGSKLLTTGEREYSGGPTEATAFATVFLEILRSLAICAFDTPSLRCSLRINAQSSKVITFPSWVGAHFSSVTSAQFSTVIDRWTVTSAAASPAHHGMITYTLSYTGLNPQSPADGGYGWRPRATGTQPIGSRES